MALLSRSLRNLDLNLLLLLEAMVRRGQLTAAAHELGLTQSAASQALSRARDALADPLFVRTGHGMVPTARTRGLIAEVGPALRRIADALEQPGLFDPISSRRTFRLSFGALGELSLLPALLGELSQATSAVTLQSAALPLAEAMAALRDADLDLVLDYEAPEDTALASHRVLTDDVVVIARRDHPRVHRDLTEEAYFGEQHVVVAVDERRRRVVEHVLGRGRHARRVAAEVAHHATVPALVAASDSLATLPRVLAQLPIYREHLQVLAPPWPLPPLSLFMVWHRSMQDDPGHVWLRGRLEGLGRAVTGAAAE